MANVSQEHVHVTRSTRVQTALFLSVRMNVEVLQIGVFVEKVHLEVSNVSVIRALWGMTAH